MPGVEGAVGVPLGLGLADSVGAEVVLEAEGVGSEAEGVGSDAVGVG